MLLIAEKDIIPIALAVIYWYIFPDPPDTPEQQEQVKGHIKTLTVILRGLLCKITLCPQDLEYALLHAQPGPQSPLSQATQTSVHSVMTQLLSVFLLHAQGTGSSYTHILQMVTGSSDPAVHACSLVYTLENMNMAVDWGREDRTRTLLQYLLPWLYSLKEQLYGTGDKAVIECLEKWMDRFNLKQKS
ncbi:uncharacterized protein LOC106168705 [Lingula anatina]|uniref:Uncharacterized protein LOC106168705 n=1 Tax=Lingula anatina TaxID=7574 RepID=A0A1S3J0I4_LINAN|nr:uncharacterized protein LOC106168705 [Lingula anatina]|eukprot:XP_013403319.1 uncharacterized protein LOC106168705 [Lingula anatina]